MIKLQKHAERTLKISAGDEILFRSIGALCEIGVPCPKAANHFVTEFTIAKRRLRLKKRTLRLLYSQKWVTPALREIMLSFVIGEVNEREARKRLKVCIAKYEQWATFSG